MYLDSGDERKNFERWYEYDEGRYGPDWSETDLLDEYRDTQCWIDDFVAWAWVMEADDRIEQHTEENNK
jgi:hypothetical protein